MTSVGVRSCRGCMKSNWTWSTRTDCAAPCAVRHGTATKPSARRSTQRFGESWWTLNAKAKKSYRVLVGINFRDQRAEPGELVDDLLPGEAEWMLADGVIEEAD